MVVHGFSSSVPFTRQATKHVSDGLSDGLSLAKAGLGEARGNAPAESGSF